MRWEQTIQYASRSDIGLRRKNNQDAFVIETCANRTEFEKHGHLLVVADGMGGHAVGELASKIAVDTLPLTFFKSREEDLGDALKHAVAVANSTINERGRQNPEFDRMGTTCSALLLSPRGAIIGHVGDSRVYRIRNGRIDQLTFDHSLQWELIRQGRMPADEVFLHEPRHVITRSLGPEPEVQIDIEGPYVILPGDTYVLCSDGLTNHVNDEEIGMVAGELPPGEACRLLVNLSNLRGGSDNVTVLIARVGDLPKGVSPVAPPPPAPAGGGLNWHWLSGFWAAAIALVGGISWMLFGELIGGGVLTALGAIGLIALIVAWRNVHKAYLIKTNAGDETVIWRPYASANAQLSKSFLNHLAAVSSELQRTGSEEKWPVEWSAHEREFNDAKQALSAGSHGRAIRALGRTIDVLMTGLHEQRRQFAHDQRWGRVPTGSSDTPA